MRKTVLISGAGSGIGLASALYLSEQGFDVVAGVFDQAQQADVEAAAAARHLSVRTVLLDVTSADSIARAVDEATPAGGSLHGVVHSAGLGLRGFFEDLSEEEIRRLFDVNVFGVMALTRAVLPSMRAARQGRVIIIGSVAGRLASMSLSGYCAGKFALEGFTESLWMEVRPLGVQVSIIEPGNVLTPHFTAHRGRAAAATNPSSPYYEWFVRHEHIVDRILQRNWIKPADVARTVHTALTVARPRMRYAVGRGARVVIWARRVIPPRWFERLYYGQVIRMVTQPGSSARELSDLSLSGQDATDYLGLRQQDRHKR